MAIILLCYIKFCILRKYKKKLLFISNIKNYNIIYDYKKNCKIMSNIKKLYIQSYNYKIINYIIFSI